MLIILRVPALDERRDFDGVPDVNVILSISTVSDEEEDRNPAVPMSIERYLIVTVKGPLRIIKI